MHNMRFSSIRKGSIGMLIGGICGVLYLAYCTLIPGTDLFTKSTALDFSIVLGGAISGFVIDKYLVHTLLPMNRYLRTYQISSTVFCLIVGTTMFLPAVVLGITFGGVSGGAIGSSFGDYGILTGMFVCIALLITFITIFGALMGAFLGAFLESMIRVVLRIGK